MRDSVLVCFFETVPSFRFMLADIVFLQDKFVRQTIQIKKTMLLVLQSSLYTISSIIIIEAILQYISREGEVLNRLFFVD